MKRFFILIFFLGIIGEIFAFNCPVTSADKLPAYYESVDGRRGKDLLDAIQRVAKIGYRTSDFRYDSVWLAFKYTDIRSDGLIWEIYSDCNFEYEKDRTSNTSQTGDCKGYNREHAMCQSWFSEYDLQGVKMSSSKKNSPGSDIFHIYPASYGMNSRRGNRPLGEVQTAAHTSGNGTKYGTPDTTMSVANSVAGPYVEGKMALSTNVLEPADEYKGDIARSYFGTMVKWAGEWAFNKNEYGKVIFDATIDADTHYGPENNYGLTPYGVAMLLRWHRQDPVSQKEIDRNNAIQLTQGNRNPFIAAGPGEWLIDPRHNPLREGHIVRNSLTHSLEEVAANGDESHHKAVDSKPDKLATLNDANHKFASQASRDECSQKTNCKWHKSYTTHQRWIFNHIENIQESFSQDRY